MLGINFVFRKCVSRTSLQLVNPFYQRRCIRCVTSALGTDFSLQNEGKSVVLDISGQPSVFHSVWLKNHCHCPQCKDPQSGRPIYRPPTSTSDIFTTIRDARIEKECLLVRFEDDHPDHQGVFPIAWLEENTYGESVLKQQAKDARPKPLNGAPAEFAYKDIQSSDDARFELYCRIIEDGLAIIRGSPAKSGVAEMFMKTYLSQCMPTAFGSGFCVTNSESAKDTAYQPGYLPHHQDMPYYAVIPGIELFHNVKRSPCIEGGESTIIDGAYVAECFRLEHPEEFDIFTKVQVQFGVYNGLKIPEFENRVFFYSYYSPHIVLGCDNEIVRFAWSPANQLALNVPAEMVEPYYRARFKFSTLLEHFHMQHIILPQPGDILVFNNRRMLHSRRPLKLNGGERVIECVFANTEEFKCEAISLALKLNRKCPATRLFNGSYV